jgi:hypothetical protein
LKLAIAINIDFQPSPLPSSSPSPSPWSLSSPQVRQWTGVITFLLWGESMQCAPQGSSQKKVKHHYNITITPP